MAEPLRLESAHFELEDVPPGPATVRADSPEYADSIRRLDWRFLLPEPPGGAIHHLVVAGAGPRLIEQAIKHGVARRVSARVRPPQRADVVAILSNTAVSPAAAARAVAPGGLLYYEVSRRRPSDALRTPGRLVREFERRGFAISAVYWLLPNGSAPLRYVPLDRTAAFRWYMDAYYSAGSPRERARELAVRGISGLDGRRFGRLAPAFTIVARAPGADAGTRAGRLAPAALGRHTLDDTARPVLITSGIDDGSRVVLMPFGAKSREPEAIVKVARIPAFNPHIRREQQTLRELRARFGASIPAPLGSFDVGELAAGVEEHVYGEAVSALSWRWPRRLDDKLADLRLVTGWLIEFNRASADRTTAPAEFAAKVRGAIAEFRAFEPGPTARECLLARIEAALHEIRGPVPVVWRHNDLGPWNVFRTSSGIRVIDWEYGSGPAQSLYGPPLADLIYFATHWYFAVSRLKTPPEEAAAFRALYFDADAPSKAAAAVRGEIRRYLAAMELDPAVFPPAFVYAWLVAALERLMRERRLGLRGEPNNFMHFLDITAANWQPGLALPDWL